MIENITKALSVTVETLTLKASEKLPEAKKTLEALLKETGGIVGLISSLREPETQEKIKTWMKDGKDFILSHEQIQKLLGDERIQKIAETASVAPEKVLQVLSEVLPPLLQKLESIGSQIPDDSLVGKAFRKLKNILKV